MPGIFRDRILDAKTAFITGGGSGIGLRIAERFAEHGARVVLAGRKRERLEAAADGIRAAGGTAETAVLDVRDYGVVEGALRATWDRFGEIDIVCAQRLEIFPLPSRACPATASRP